MRAYLDSTSITGDGDRPLFRTVSRSTDRSIHHLSTANAYAVVRRHAEAAGIAAKIGNHTFRATGITAYLRNVGMLERAAAIANHASTRSTQHYDSRSDDVTWTRSSAS